MPPYLDNTGTLTEQGRDELLAVQAALSEVMLQQRYGCPDCADGGASYVTLAHEDEVSSHVYEYGNPPPELSAVDALLTALMDALAKCRETELIDIAPGCVPRPS